MFATSDQVSILSVTKLNRFAKRVLESEIGLVWVTGEISNFVAASSGHWYFTLKDNQAQVRSAMFKGANQRIGFRPKQGDKVLVRASIGLYEPRGDYQLIVQHMEPEGVGQLKQQFEALKHALSQEGLFSDEAKQALPTTINRIGVITSPTGAAIHDILHVLARRNPSVEVVLYPTAVQGELAAPEIVKQIIKANQRNEVDVLIVGRGGGSLEDLWPFNEETVARAIHQSFLPIVSAVGHEIDVTIADFVADMRAPTPSAAAELLSKDAQVLKQQIRQQLANLSAAFNRQHRIKAHGFDVINQGLKNQSPQRLIENNAQGLDNLLHRLNNSHPQNAIEVQSTKIEQLKQQLERGITNALQNMRQKHRITNNSLNNLSPAERIETLQNALVQKESVLHNSMQNVLKMTTQQLSAKTALLDSVSPLSTMARGYSITFSEDSHSENKILRSIDEIHPKQLIKTRLTDGEFTAEVIDKK